MRVGSLLVHILLASIFFAPGLVQLARLENASILDGLRAWAFVPGEPSVDAHHSGARAS